MTFTFYSCLILCSSFNCNTQECGHLLAKKCMNVKDEVHEQDTKYVFIQLNC